MRGASPHRGIIASGIAFPQAKKDRSSRKRLDVVAEMRDAAGVSCLKASPAPARTGALSFLAQA